MIDRPSFLVVIRPLNDIESIAYYSDFWVLMNLYDPDPPTIETWYIYPTGKMIFESVDTSFNGVIVWIFFSAKSPLY